MLTRSLFSTAASRLSHAVNAAHARHISMTTTIPDVVQAMKQHQQHRAYLVYDPTAQQIKVSHPLFNQIAQDLLADKRDFHQHEAIFLEVGPVTGALHSATVHKTVRGQSAGGVRLWAYNNLQEYLRDGLRLAEGMGRKNALAGLWHGGGKGVIHRVGDIAYHPAYRRTLFQEYGSFITSLRGCYVTAEDVGVNLDDMRNIFSRTRFTTCIPYEVGGSSNPSILTGHGVVSAMEGALDFAGKGTLQGKVIAVQGLGNVAQAMIAKLLTKGVKKIVGSDVNPRVVEKAKSLFKDSKIPVECHLVPLGDNSILFHPEADIVSPCALGGILNSETIPRIKAGIVCGAANNQLLDDQVHDKLISKHNILYVPDFLANRMGITNCANESYGYVNDDPAIYRHFDPQWENSLFTMTKTVLGKSATDKISSAEAAIKIADALALQPHPIWNHRSKLIIDSLVADEWHKQPHVYM